LKSILPVTTYLDGHYGLDDICLSVPAVIGRGGVEHVLVVNVLNDREYVPGIPKDFEVEVPALCGSHGISPIATQALPKPILALALRDRVAPVEMELAAYENHDKQLLIDLIMMDPRSHSRKQAEALLDEILELPYHQEMKAWYK